MYCPPCSSAPRPIDSSPCSPLAPLLGLTKMDPRFGQIENHLNSGIGFSHGNDGLCKLTSAFPSQWPGPVHAGLFSWHRSSASPWGHSSKSLAHCNLQHRRRRDCEAGKASSWLWVVECISPHWTGIHAEHCGFIALLFCGGGRRVKATSGSIENLFWLGNKPLMQAFVCKCKHVWS